MNRVLIIGSGGREHALARAFARSRQVSHIYVAPGNPGMTVPGRISCVPILTTAIEELADFVMDKGISLTFVGGEQALELGIVDYFREKDLAIVGPTKQAAQLESSKNFAKEIMSQAQVKTAKHHYFAPKDYDKALKFIEDQGMPLVIKADGLMAGKGVVIPESLREAKESLARMMQDKKVPLLIEEMLVGPEFSHFSLVNGDHIIPIGTACDYKRVYDNDRGVNTGGMGAFAPVPWFDDKLSDQVIEEIVRPVAQQMMAHHIPFTGVLYTGIMLTAEGPKVIEFNTRFGDPETQILLPLLENDFMDIVLAHLNQSDIKIQVKDQYNLGVVIASQGYPGPYQLGMPITLSDSVKGHVYYAGVSSNDQDELIAAGGRILMVTGQARSLEEAREKTYEAIQAVSIPNSFYRHDIGLHR